MRPELKLIGDAVIGAVGPALAEVRTRLDKHDRSAESAAELLADLDARLTLIETRLAAVEAARQ